MGPLAIAGSFWRGGTSRGLLLRASALGPFTPRARQRAILSALGSPDPDGRQIDGLGGGVSSLSKVAIIGAPGEASEDQARLGKLPGVEWADDGQRDGLGRWDIVYRFGQVAVCEPAIDWKASCGNMLSAVALAAVTDSIVPYSTLFTRARSLPRPEEGHPLMFPLEILSASNGALMRARVPLDPLTLQVWEPAKGQGTSIAGVPGEAAGIEVEMPIQTGKEAPGELPTRNTVDVINVDGEEVSLGRSGRAESAFASANFASFRRSSCLSSLRACQTSSSTSPTFPPHSVSPPACLRSLRPRGRRTLRSSLWSSDFATPPAPPTRNCTSRPARPRCASSVLLLLKDTRPPPWPLSAPRKRTSSRGR